MNDPFPLPSSIGQTKLIFFQRLLSYLALNVIISIWPDDIISMA